MKLFDLEKALAGEPLKDLHNGEKCWFIGESKLTDDYIFQNEEGECFAVTKNVEHIQKGYAMWQEPRPRVQLDLPTPLETVQKGQEVYFIEPVYALGGISEIKFNEKLNKHIELYENGFLFATKEDAQEWLDAMRNARR